MKQYMQSYTIVPDEYYVERSADKQIVNLINDMGRPGYVLVARQMGKTNLLLHAKSKLEDSKNVFVYLDFSVIPVYDDKAFFELLINKAIENRNDTFAEAKTKIDRLRKERLYDSVNRYTAELIILLEYVDKIVFILDEIEAVTKSKYSDSIFSQIRSDYFQRVNYKALYRVTYVLSGVFEPKDLIKDPNISPFNIGEKIYLRSFNRKESDLFIEKAGLSFSEEVKERIFYWTNGHPRMLNDICHDLQYEDDPKIETVDDIVFRCYLEAFDKAPIDGIRRNIEADSILRDSVIQLIMVPESLDIEVKQRLYLAGIGDYQGTRFAIKNPIIKEAIPLEWLQGLSQQKKDVLKTASSLIYLDKKYNDAIELLKKYVSLGDADANQLNEAYYYLGLCYFRKYETEESQRYLEQINTKAEDGFDIIMQSYLIKGYNYSNLSMSEECIRSYEMILNQRGKISTDLYAKAYIGKVDALINGDDEDVRQAKDMMLSFVNTAEVDGFYGYRAISYYELSAIEERLGNTKKACEYIDDATQFAEPGEMPTLLYYKLIFLENEGQKNETIEKLLSYLKSTDKKPEIEDFDKMLGLNYFTLACIMSEIILYHEDYIDKFDVYLKWYNSSKESAYNSIMKYLRNFNDSNTLPFAKKILQLKDEDGWLFGSDHIFNALSTVYKCETNIKNALILYDYIEKNNYTDNRKEVALALINVAKVFIDTEKYDKALKVISFYRTQFSEVKDPFVNALSFINDYYETLIMLAKDNLEEAKLLADKFLKRAEGLTEDDYESIRPLRRDSIENMCKDVRAALYSKQVALEPRQPIVKNYSFGRNDWVKATYFTDSHEVTTKFKNVQEDFENNLCRVEKIKK